MLKGAILTQKKMFRNKKIFVRENLTNLRYKLFKKAREFASANNYKFVWTKKCKIYMRKNEDTDVILVRDYSTFDGLKMGSKRLE